MIKSEELIIKSEPISDSEDNLTTDSLRNNCDKKVNAHLPANFVNDICYNKYADTKNLVQVEYKQEPETNFIHVAVKEERISDGEDIFDPVGDVKQGKRDYVNKALL